MKTVLITGCAGFIGFHFTKKLLDQNKFKIIGVDMMNDYYDVNLKKNRLKIIKNHNSAKKKFKFFKINIVDKKLMNNVFKNNKIDFVVNLAAQAGVRDSLKVPEKYLNYNILGFLNILELSKNYSIKHLVYASTSSVYGLNYKTPFSAKDTTDHPQQFYAVTKKTNELMAHAWCSLYNIRATGLRFFTVYGPYGRPDMALFKFTKNIYENKPIEVFNNGNHIRDFTYVDDIVNGIYLAMNKYPMAIKDIKKINSANSIVNHKIYNLGCGKEVKLKKFISLIESNLNKKSIKNNLPIQKGDIVKTSADISITKKELGYNPKVNVEEGIKNFVEWYKSYYKFQ